VGCFPVEEFHRCKDQSGTDEGYKKIRNYAPAFIQECHVPCVQRGPPEIFYRRDPSPSLPQHIPLQTPPYEPVFIPSPMVDLSSDAPRVIEEPGLTDLDIAIVAAPSSDPLPVAGAEAKAAVPQANPRDASTSPLPENKESPPPAQSPHPLEALLASVMAELRLLRGEVVHRGGRWEEGVGALAARHAGLEAQLQTLAVRLHYTQEAAETAARRHAPQDQTPPKLPKKRKPKPKPKPTTTTKKPKKPPVVPRTTSPTTKGRKVVSKGPKRRG